MEAWSGDGIGGSTDLGPRRMGDCKAGCLGLEK